MDVFSRELRADAERRRDQHARGIILVEVDVQIGQPDHQRGAPTRKILFDPRLVQLHAAVSDLDIVDALHRPRQRIDRSPLIAEYMEMRARAAPAGQPVEVAIGRDLEIVEHARPPRVAASDVAHEIDDIASRDRDGT
jgi:hypothetical protein